MRRKFSLTRYVYVIWKKFFEKIPATKLSFKESLPEEAVEEDEELFNDSDDQDEHSHDDAALNFDQDAAKNIELSQELKELVDKIRATVKMFRNSPVMSDTLRKCVKEEFGEEKQLKLDVKTRW